MLAAPAARAGSNSEAGGPANGGGSSAGDRLGLGRPGAAGGGARGGRAADLIAGPSDGVGIGRGVTVDPLAVLLQQEIGALNATLGRVGGLLLRCGGVLGGEAAGGPEEEEAIAALSRGRMPEPWLQGDGETAAAHSSPHGWLRWMQRRAGLLSSWAAEGRPAVVWLGGLSRPSALPATLLQKAARDVGLPADALRLECVVRSDVQDDGEALGRGRRFLATVEAQDAQARTVKTASALFGDKFKGVVASKAGRWGAAVRGAAAGTGAAAARAKRAAASAGAAGHAAQEEEEEEEDEWADSRRADARLRAWGGDWDEAARPMEVPEDGMLVGGLWLDGARWTGGAQAGKVGATATSQPRTRCPVVWLVPVLRVDDGSPGEAHADPSTDEPPLQGGPDGEAPASHGANLTHDAVWSGLVRWRPRGSRFVCPVFSDAARARVLFSVPLCCGEDTPPQAWTRKGVALLAVEED